MNSQEFKRIREWCHEHLDATDNPIVLAAIVKLCDAVATLEAGGSPPESDAETEALAERIINESTRRPHQEC